MRIENCLGDWTGFEYQPPVSSCVLFFALFGSPVIYYPENHQVLTGLFTLETNPQAGDLGSG